MKRIGHALNHYCIEYDNEFVLLKWEMRFVLVTIASIANCVVVWSRVTERKPDAVVGYVLMRGMCP